MPRRGRKGIFALDNLWDGLGAIVVIEPTVRYLFGKFTMYPSYDRMARDMILYFLGKHFPDPDNLIYPMKPLKLWHDPEQFKQLFTESEKDGKKVFNDDLGEPFGEAEAQAFIENLSKEEATKLSDILVKWKTE